MAKLILKKTVLTSGEMEIFLDEQKIGVLSDKEPHEFEITVGEHTFLAKTKWLGSADFTFISSEESPTRLTISDKQNQADIPLIFIVLSILGVVGVKQSSNAVNLIIPLILCILITVVVCVFYLRTLGTNERMEVRES